MRPHPGPLPFVVLLMAFATLCLPLATHAQTTNADPVPTPDAVQPATPEALASLPPAGLAHLVAQKVDAVAQASSHYTYYDTELSQQTMDGALVVNHTTISESIFLGGVPYLHRLSVDGKPLEGKELAREDKLYNQAIHDRTSLDAATRARLNKSLLRSTSRTDFDQLATYFVLKTESHQLLSNHDCLVLDASPLPGLDVASVQRHIRVALDAFTGDLVDISIEFLADDSGFSKGTLLHTRYAQVDNVTLPADQTFDTVIVFKELLGKPVTVHTVHTYSNYRRFRATVTIKVAGDQPPPPPESSTPARSTKSSFKAWFRPDPAKPVNPPPPVGTPSPPHSN